MAVFSIMLLSYLLKDAGIVDSLVTRIKKRFPGLLSFIILPASIGLFPMPGGALFSAPMVEKADTKSLITGGRKAAINYWFRHIWEFWLPLYPGVLLAANLSGLPILDFAKTNIAFTLISVLAGSLFLLLPVRDKIKKEKPDTKDSRLLPMPFLEISIVLATYIAGYFLIPDLSSKGYVSLLAGTILAIITLISRSPIDIKKALKTLRNPKLWNFMLIVLLIKIYSFLLSYPLGEKNIMQLISEQFLATGIPPVILISILPLISGLVMGIAVGFVGISFPIVISIISALPAQHSGIYIMLAYISGYTGMMLSPLHICLIVSSEYFSSSLIKNIKYLIGPASTILITAILYALISL